MDIIEEAQKVKEDLLCAEDNFPVIDKHPAVLFSEAAETIRALVDKLKAADGVVEESKPIAHFLKWRLAENECECEGRHICGHNERTRELKSYQEALARYKND